MRRHLSLRSGNPALNKNTFKNFTDTSISNQMTIDGTVNKTMLSLIVLFISAYYSWNSFNQSLIVIGSVGGFITALITIFKKHLAMYTVPVYAVFKGLMLGSLSYIFESSYPGIVNQAVFLTFGIMGALLFAYKTKIINPTENFKLGVFAATGGIAIIYIINFIMSFWGGGISVMSPNNSSMFSIGFSFFVVIIASLNLVLDFDFIEEAAEAKVPKYMEWYAAFGLLITLIWLYIEILRLLAKLQNRRN
tara:strand:- start:197 stop:943 length:747 start_codon:yes stop_codon:yes gene_type:complete